MARSTKETTAYHGDIESNLPTANYAKLPLLTQWLEAFSKKENSHLERVYIAVLEPHGKVHEHWDAGTYYIFRERYHLPLKTKGTRVRINRSTEVHFRVGEVWWINNRLLHEFSNDSEQERIHVIFDLLPNSITRRMINALNWAWAMMINRFQNVGKNGSPVKTRHET